MTVSFCNLNSYFSTYEWDWVICFSLWVIFIPFFKYKLFLSFTHFSIILLVLASSKLWSSLYIREILVLYLAYLANILNLSVIWCYMICQFLKVPSTPTYRPYYQECILLFYLPLPLFYCPLSLFTSFPHYQSMWYVPNYRSSLVPIFILVLCLQWNLLKSYYKLQCRSFLCHLFIWIKPSSGRLCFSIGFPCGSTGKESTCNLRDLSSIPALGRSPGEGKGYPLQYSGLGNSPIVHGITKSQTRLSDGYKNLWFTISS